MIYKRIVHTSSADDSCYWRAGNRSSVAAALKDAAKLHALVPDYLAGFDIVYREDTGNLLVYYIDELLHSPQIGVDLPYFLHAGETSK